MSNPKTKLELTRVGKHTDFQLEPRILIEKPELSNNARRDDLVGRPSENILIHGDNLLALKALEQEFSGMVKCIYIDPPYNTGNAFEHYDDGLEHSEWLSLMKPRLELLRNLLSDDGSIWVSIDADESHYLKVLCDEIFWRQNFVDEVIRQRAYSPINLKKTLSRSHDTILVYAKNFDQKFTLNKLPRSDDATARYKNPDNDPRWMWQSDNLSVWPAVQKNIYPITNPSWRECMPPNWYSWRVSQEKLQEMITDNRIWFGEEWKNTPRIKRFLSEVKDWVVAMTLWTHPEVGHNQDAKREVKMIVDDDIFATPKPERLIQRILHLWSNPWDLVLDSFLWSWTTTAVAHKMWRRWIGIELGDHAYTHAKVRMDKVIEGEQGGISKLVDWKWWGGYKFYELWPSVLIKDQYDNYIINPEFDSNMLIQSLCKIENFTYKAYIDTTKHGYSTEKDFIHVTTRHITQEIINDILNDTLKNGETLLIVAKTFAHDLTLPDTIQIKKIPPEILGKCSYDKSDYNLPVTAHEIDDQDAEDLE